MASRLIFFITILSTRISSTTPPRPRADFSLMPRSVPSKTQLEMVTLRTLPDTSLPITTPPWPLSIVQLVMVTFSVGTFHFLPSISRPDFMVIESSPTLMWQSEIRTLRHEVGLIPSVLGEGGLLMVTPRIVILSENAGLMVQKGELTTVTSSILILLHSKN